MPYTEFHYTPTGTGVISGKEVLEQTEDAINDLGGQISGDVQTAIDTANNALNTANTASADAQNAVNTANTAYTAATNAQNTANAAQTTASNALTAAQNAQNDVNALGNRVTTAENNISQNTSDISGLTTRMGTAEGNITNLQNDVITAQGSATSAQNTATLAREQAYVTRYTNTAVSDNSTVAYSDLNNTDNIKIGDFILDVNGKLYAITAVDTANETVSVTTPLTQLAVDSGVVHNSGDEVVNGVKNFKDLIPIDGDYLGGEASTNQRTNICLRANRDTAGKSCAYITRFRQNRTQGGLLPLDLQMIGFDILENEVRTNNVLLIQCTDWLNNVPQKVNIISGALSYSFGNSARKALLNDINPGALSLPDLDSAIDISGYIDISQLSEYTAPADGYISICGYASSSSTNAILIKDKNYDFAMTSRALLTSLGATTYLIIPVVKNHVYEITCAAVTTLSYAYFYPCLGNV